jgi:16S rRNA (guanine527-N7)-methyltransferase
VTGQPPLGLRAAAEQLFGERLPLAQRYAELLATVGIERGLLGPREAERVWERHLLNSAVLESALARDRTVVDVGSGAGLPGIPLALARPDLRVCLLEPMLRRVRFLDEVIAELSLGQVSAVRGRAPEDAAALPFTPDYAVARAVAPLDRLVSWTMPLVRMGGELLALRGQSANEEARTARQAVARAGGRPPTVHRLGEGLLPEPVTVVQVVRQQPTSRRRSTNR